MLSKINPQFEIILTIILHVWWPPNHTSSFRTYRYLDGSHSRPHIHCIFHYELLPRNSLYSSFTLGIKRTILQNLSQQWSPQLQPPHRVRNGLSHVEVKACKTIKVFVCPPITKSTCHLEQDWNWCTTGYLPEGIQNKGKILHPNESCWSKNHSGKQNSWELVKTPEFWPFQGHQTTTTLLNPGPCLTLPLRSINIADTLFLFHSFQATVFPWVFWLSLFLVLCRLLLPFHLPYIGMSWVSFLGPLLSSIHTPFHSGLIQFFGLKYHFSPQISSPPLNPESFIQ